MYLLFPVLLAARQRWGIARCLGLTLVVSFGWRIFAVALWGLPEHVITAPFSSPLMTWFDWTLGACVAESVFRQRPLFRQHAVCAVALGLLFLLSTLYKPLTPFSFTLAAAVSAVVLDRMARTRFQRNLPLRGLTFVGIISYSIYLWHQPLLGKIGSRLERFLPDLPARLGAAIAIMLGAWISYRLLELGGIKLGRTLWPRIAPAPPRKLAWQNAAQSGQPDAANGVATTPVAQAPS